MGPAGAVNSLPVNAGYAATRGRNSHKESLMPFYEHVFIARQELSPQQVEDLASAILPNYRR